MANARAIPAATEVRFNRFLALVYLVMAVGMAITAVVATSVSNNPVLVKRIVTNAWFAFGLFMIQIIIVVWLSAAVMRMSSGLSLILFLFYSALTGLSLSSIFIYYSKSAIAYTFWVTAGMFLFSSIVGFFIKGEMSGMGRFLMLALMGWLFGWIFVLIFPRAEGLNELMNFTGILLFAGLTVWDTNRLKQLSTELEGKQGMGSLAIMGSLVLYLDFINMFLLLLRTSRR
jgi:FtsH-binding integral membrane protein